jgi:hypothetical protein
MRRIPLLSALSLLLGCLAFSARPVLADCVSCGTMGECYSVSPGFSANCECKIRVFNGVSTCKPSGICDPNDPNTCSGNDFPQNIAAHPKLPIPFINDLAQVNSLLAGAVWAGIGEANSSPDPEGAEAKGTMGREGRSYTYRARVHLLADGSAKLAVHVQQEGTQGGVDYEGTVSRDGLTVRFSQVGSKDKTPIFSRAPRSTKD